MTTPLRHPLKGARVRTGAIVKVLRAAGHTVIATDLVDYGCPDKSVPIFTSA